jgi:cobalt-zinc-cadmium efflux system protein
VSAPARPPARVPEVGPERAGHAVSHAHGHAHAGQISEGGLVVVLAITTAFMATELVGGWLANSLALLADGVHMLADVGALALSLFALWFARRPATSEKTFGYVRLEILAALVNGAFLLVIASWIVWEAIQRVGKPEPVKGGLMLGVAIAGMLANIVSAAMLHRSAGHSLNVRGAYLHVLGDLVGSFGAIVAGAIILATGWWLADPIVSFLVALLVVASSWRLLRESVDVLLEAVPAHIDLDQVRAAIEEVPGIEQVHDLHVWTLNSGFLAMSGHAIVQNPADAQRILDQVHERLRDAFAIRHATIQLESPAPVQLRPRPG